MGSLRIVGIALLVIGVGLLVVGVNSSNSVADQVHNTFTGRFTDTTIWYMITGAVTGVVGLVLTIGGAAGGKSA